MPDEGAYLFEWFAELATARQEGMNGPQALTHFDMLAWAQLTGNVVYREEWLVLRQMDRAFLSAVAVEQVDAMARAKAAKKTQR